MRRLRYYVVCEYTLGVDAHPGLTGACLVRQIATSTHPCTICKDCPHEFLKAQKLCIVPAARLAPHRPDPDRPSQWPRPRARRTPPASMRCSRCWRRSRSNARHCRSRKYWPMFVCTSKVGGPLFWLASGLSRSSLRLLSRGMVYLVAHGCESASS